MAPVIPDPGRIKSFRTGAAFEKWQTAQNEPEPEHRQRVNRKD